MGRPMTQHTELVAFRISPALLAEVEGMGEDEGVSRSEMLRTLLEDGLKFREAVQRGAA